jgi:hypothetical protein
MLLKDPMTILLHTSPIHSTALMIQSRSIAKIICIWQMPQHSVLYLLPHSLAYSLLLFFMTRRPLTSLHSGKFIM